MEVPLQNPSSDHERRASEGPVSIDERSASLDGIRGIALFGVLLVNEVTLFRVSLFAQFLPGGTPVAATPTEQTLETLIAVFFEFKAFAVFSLLFGVGLAAQRERAQRAKRPFFPYATRRLSFLLVLGLTHLVLIWNGDILTLYAIVGMCAAPLLRLPTKWIALAALVTLALHLSPLPLPNPFDSVADLRAHVERANHIYPYGGFTDVLAFRIAEVRPIVPLLMWAFMRTLALMLAGACAWRWRLFTSDVKGPRALVIVVALFTAGMTLTLGARAHSFHGLSDGITQNASSVLLALGYVGALLLLHATKPGARLIALCAPVGRMALTSYLSQSIVLGFLFYGYGFGMYGRTSIATTIWIAIVLYILQIGLARAWLSRFRFGPVEWLWRSFTYGKRAPFRV